METDEQIKRAYESILANDFEKAMEWFQDAIKAEPENADLHYKLSITCARSNKLAMALEHAGDAVRYGNGHAEYCYHYDNLKARDFIQKSEKILRGPKELYNQAELLLKEAIRLDPLTVEGHLLLAFCYAELGDYAPAVIMVKEALRLDPNHDEAKKLHATYELQQRK